MARKPIFDSPKLTEEQVRFLEEKMQHLADRNPAQGLDRNDFATLFPYLAVQKITYLYDDELFENLEFVDTAKTGKSEELLDAYMILDQGDEIHLKLFQFKFRQKYDSGISTKELYAFVDRMNRVFLHGDLQDAKTLESFAEIRGAFDKAREANKRAKTRVHCYFIVNGQNVSGTDSEKLEEIRNTFSHDRQTYGFTFEAFGGRDIYDLFVQGRLPIQEETLELNYEFNDGSFLHHNIGPNPNGMPPKVLVGFVNVNQLIRLVDRYSNSELFEKNVRLFLGTTRYVNRNIIETITGNKSPWFGFMNNGVSITAEDVSVDLPPSKSRVRVRLNGMQIINGCQTVNALYHAKYSPELKDRFQGNSNVLVRIYQVTPADKSFLDALIIATNSQNAIRPEDLLSNDKIQRTFQDLLREIGVGYERKEGETLPGHSYQLVFSKEQAAMAYLAVFKGSASKLRNSLSRRQFFREGDDYYKVFNLLGPDGEENPAPLPDEFVPNESSRRRILEIVVARVIELTGRKAIANLTTKTKGPLRKGAFFLARIIYLLNETTIQDAINEALKAGPTPKTATSLIEQIEKTALNSFDKACKIFNKVLQDYLMQLGGSEDSALKNSAFDERLEAEVKSNISVK